jgi:hypothetical protein
MDIEFPNDAPPRPPEPKPQEDSSFGPVVYSYTRKQAIADGIQIDVSSVAREAGLRFPVFITRSVYDSFVAVPPGVAGQDEAGRLWDVVWMLRCAIAGSHSDSPYLRFQLYVRNDNRQPHLVTLHSVCAPLDVDDPQPAITVMVPGED